MKCQRRVHHCRTACAGPSLSEHKAAQPTLAPEEHHSGDAGRTQRQEHRQGRLGNDDGRQALLVVFAADDVPSIAISLVLGDEFARPTPWAFAAT